LVGWVAGRLAHAHLSRRWFDARTRTGEAADWCTPLRSGKFK